MGTLPIALGTGAGANSRRPLGLSVVGGLIFAQIVTLYLPPAFYTYMDSFQTWLSRGRQKEPGRERLALSHEPLLAPQAKGIEQNP
jgi:hydrophobic/amphiphilic exporter-1 (mainly G- bacteria), HAE1 family